MHDSRLHYIISMTNPSSHYFEVNIEVRDITSDRLRFSTPVWTPGSYLVREFSRNILEFGAYDLGTGVALSTWKESKNTWVVETSGSKNLNARYKVYAFEYTVDTSYLDDLHAVINGGSVFMYVEGLEGETIVLSIEKSKKWTEVSTGLETARSEDPRPTFIAENYDMLVDSPIEVGNQRVHSFMVKNVEHQLSVYSNRKFDQDALVSDLKKIVESTIAVMGQIPYKRYVFLVDFTDEKYGGLEHSNSTHCMASFFKLEPTQEYKKLLSLFSHEFFHAWNVKRMRPVGLGPFNYSSETYTRSLWIAEGITSYYDDLLIRRAGIYSVSEYLDALCSNFNLISLDGSKWQSAEESSFDTWIKHYRQNENSINSVCSYYTQGAVTGWMLDLEIMRKTNGEKRLDDVMRL
ncbi:MAG: M61 family metallopeptidase, partial [Nitrososphaerota archaeon]|nr:M61 family metallopeptidase [Nitrososphaerota archaeon]